MKRILTLVAIVFAVFGCQQDTTVKFGAVLPLTGDWAIYGQPVRKGVELAYEHLQARTDLPFPVELQIVDSASDPQQAKALLQEQFGKV